VAGHIRQGCGEQPAAETKRNPRTLSQDAEHRRELKGDDEP
jgi:hypothetical protein